MRAKSLGMVFSAVLFVATVAFTQSPDQNTGQNNANQTDQKGTPGQAGQDATMTGGQQVHTGQVTKYEAGKTLEIRMQDGQTRTFNLSDFQNATIDPNVRVGSEVKVSEMTRDGQKTLMVEPFRAASGSQIESERPLGAQTEAERAQSAPIEGERAQTTPSESERAQSAQTEAAQPLTPQPESQQTKLEAERAQSAPVEEERAQTAPAQTEAERPLTSQPEGQRTQMEAERAQSAPIEGERTPATPMESQQPAQSTPTEGQLAQGEVETLPRTASGAPLLGLFGLLSVAIAAGMRVVSKKLG
jgi:hypothetical protein